MTYMILAGEASGDLHGSELIRCLQAEDPEAQFIFFGGDKMARQAGHAPVVHYREMAYMGFSEVLRNLGKIGRNLKQARSVLRTTHPDALILIDYPSFNLKVAKTAAQLHIPVYYYISPKIWAWKEWRAKTIRKLVRRMFVIFPFEVDYYREKHGMEVEYVGNPSVAEVDRALAAAPALEDFCRANRLRTNRPIIALMPGSRRGEIRNNLSVMQEAVKGFVQYQPVIAGAPGIDDEVYAGLTNLPVVRDTAALLRHARAALVTSGTATLEAALAGVPQVACYRSNGSKLAYNIMHRILSVPFVTLPNLICNRRIIAEQLLHECTPEAVAAALSPLTGLQNRPRLQMLEDYAEMRSRLGTSDAALRTAQAILADLHKVPN